MKKKLIYLIFFICIVLVTIIGVVFSQTKLSKNSNVSNENVVLENPTVLYDSNGNIIYDATKLDEVDYVTENTSILGIVELKRDKYIYIFNGFHFGEKGIEIEDYTNANIDNRGQECIDYITKEKYDTNYIEEGDVLICNGDLIYYKYRMIDNKDFDTKNNPIIVLKAKDFNAMKKESIEGKRSAIVTIVEYYENEDDIFIKYEITDNGYKLPFILKMKNNNEISINGDLQEGKQVKIEYKDVKVQLDDLEIKSISTIE